MYYPWTGISKPELPEKIKDWLQQIGEASLKPLQKVDILKGYTIPRLIYLADQADVKVMYLQTLDLAIRTAVKKRLHLPASTCDAMPSYIPALGVEAWVLPDSRG